MEEAVVVEILSGSGYGGRGKPVAADVSADT